VVRITCRACRERLGLGSLAPLPRHHCALVTCSDGIGVADLNNYDRLWRTGDRAGLRGFTNAQPHPMGARALVLENGARLRRHQRAAAAPRVWATGPLGSAIPQIRRIVYRVLNDADAAAHRAEASA
jgi:hypothetical protein